MLLRKTKTLFRHISFATETGDGAYSKFILFFYFFLNKCCGAQFRNIERIIKVNLNGHTFPVALRVQDYFIIYEVFGERVYERVLQSPIRKGDVVLDLGAHIGLSSLFFGILFPGVTIVSVEPSDDNFRLLSQNIKGLHNSSIILNAAVSSEDGVIDFYKNGYIYSNGSILPNTSGIKSKVKSFTLDSLISQYRPTLIKFDIEGGEEIILSSAKRINEVKTWVGEIEASLEGEKKILEHFSGYPMHNVEKIGKFLYIYFSR